MKKLGRFVSEVRVLTNLLSSDQRSATGFRAVLGTSTMPGV